MVGLQEISRRSSLLSACVFAAGLIVAGGSLAEPAEPGEPAAHPLRISGFGTIGVTHTAAPPNWGFQRESGQASNDGGTRIDTDSRLGLQANYAIDPRVDLVGQLLLTRRSPQVSAGDAVAWAFAAYRPTDSLMLRVGRVNTNLFQLSDYRSVGLAYPFVRPPTEFYSLLPNAIDGLDLTRSWRDAGDAIWKVAGYYGRTQQVDNRSKSIRTVRPIYGGFISREEEGLTLKASFSQLRLGGNGSGAASLLGALQQLSRLPVPEVAAQAAALQQPFLAGQMVDYLGLGLNLDRDDWLLMLEVSHAELRGAVTFDAGYALLGRRFGGLTPYAAVSAVHSRAQGSKPQWQGLLTPLLGPAAAARAQALGEAAYNAVSGGPGQRTASFGLRWDRSARTALKLQYDRTRIGTRGSLLWANGSDEAANAHVLTATFDFVF